MNIDFTIVLVAFLPALLVAGVAVYMINATLKKELLKQKYQLLKASEKELLPLKIQTCERLSLFVERNSLQSLVKRVVPVGDSKEDYKGLIVATLNPELEHNLTQQIYVSDECWNAIELFKRTIIKSLIELSLNEELKTAQDIREFVIASQDQNNSKAIVQSILRTELTSI